MTNVVELDLRLTCYGGREYHSLPLSHVLLVGGVGTEGGLGVSSVGSIVVLELLVPAFHLD